MLSDEKLLDIIRKYDYGVTELKKESTEALNKTLSVLREYSSNVSMYVDQLSSSSLKIDGNISIISNLYTISNFFDRSVAFYVELEVNGICDFEGERKKRYDVMMNILKTVRFLQDKLKIMLETLYFYKYSSILVFDDKYVANRIKILNEYVNRLNLTSNAYQISNTTKQVVDELKKFLNAYKRHDEIYDDFVMLIRMQYENLLINEFDYSRLIKI